jgi:hypothetical protein
VTCVATLFIAQMDLVLHIVTLIMLFVSLGLKFMKRMFLHGATMLIALVLHTISFVTVMWPSFRLFYPYVYNTFSFITVTHAALGTVTLILAIWLIASWHFQRSFKSCTRWKKVMLLVFIMWIIALFLGILLYLYLYTNLVPQLY